MKACSTFLMALGLVSSAAMAQSDRPAPEQAPGRMANPGTTTHPTGPSRMPMPTMGSEAGAVAPAEKPADTSGTLSSGASSTEMAPSGSSGQLITPTIAQSRPAAATTVGVKPQQTKDGVTYMCGGIGEDESTYMKQTAARDYDLMMTFAEKSGNYVADVNVSIKDAHGKSVLDTTCDGPILLVDLPAGGGYRIHAETGGQAIDRTVLVKGGKAPTRQLTFAWPGKPAVAAGKKAGRNGESGRESAGGDDGN
ncbi:hypothetical protein [Noviherbaspirillum sedimenti]|uniref:Carboxypeptidase regulatory-like domain-containing protein n=1 Tax=Noviherbaspirillum sedimenti TaxID=2320865 RepID=A0A3A3G512_9BURK|nr:hypothetical protein [Noviherbaspirillum sedimenti]RJG01582.1 hypothetical protein D3878_08280 [Noviherbaspirillum sedimenti]